VRSNRSNPSEFDETVRLYEKQNPNVTVNAVLQQTDMLIPAFKSAAAAGEGPDIQYFWGGIWTLEDAWLGNLAPISDYWSDEQLDHLLLGARAETFWNGKQWGVPFYQIGCAWAYNEKLFKKAGLDPENPPVKWENYIEAGKKLRKIGVAPIGGGIKDGWLGGWLISYYGHQTLDDFQDLVNAITGKESFTEPI
jgi:multiple sugar transport system substrate-binding protein